MPIGESGVLGAPFESVLIFPALGRYEVGDSHSPITVHIRPYNVGESLIWPVTMDLEYSGEAGDWWDTRWAFRQMLATPLGYPDRKPDHDDIQTENKDNAICGPYTSGINYLGFTVDLQNLKALGYIQGDSFEDVRIIFTSGVGASYRHWNLPYKITELKNQHKIYFQVVNDIPVGIDISKQLGNIGWGYYIYFGNPSGETLNPPSGTYTNYNFPQAPYTPASGYNPNGATSGFYDRFLYLLNDDPAVGNWYDFYDKTERTTGQANNTWNAATSENEDNSLDKGWVDLDAHGSGTYPYFAKLDAAIHVHGVDASYDPDQYSYIEATGENWTIPSGNWCIDFWVRDVGSQPSGRLFSKKFDESSDELVVQYSSGVSPDLQVLYYWNGPGNEVEDVTIPIDSTWKTNNWNHVRIAYMDGLGGESTIVAYINGVFKKAGNAISSTLAYHSTNQPGTCRFCGGNTISPDYYTKAYFEQFRFSTFPFFAAVGQASGNICPPDFVTNEYMIKLDYLEGYATVENSSNIGGYILSHAQTSGSIGGISEAVHGETSGSIGGWAEGVFGSQNINVGGYVYAPMPVSGFIGCWVEGIKGGQNNAVGGIMYSDAPSSSGDIGGATLAEAPSVTGDIGGYMLGDAAYDFVGIGGYVDALRKHDASGMMGGVAFAAAGSEEEHVGGFTIGTWSIEGNSIVEALTRALSKGVDFQVYRQEFGTNSQLSIYAINEDQFDAKLTIDKVDDDRFDALMEIIKIKRNPSVTIIDTDITGTGPWTVNITASGHAFDINNNILGSGIEKATFIWTDGETTRLSNVATSGYIFSASHTYTVSGVYRPIVMGYDKLGIAGSDDTIAALASGDYPAISLSGTPREGLLPPSLYVDFIAETSGIVGSHTIYWDYGNGLTQFNNALATSAQYVMAGDYIPYIRLVDSRGVPVVDTLRIGYNR